MTVAGTAFSRLLGMASCLVLCVHGSVPFLPASSCATLPSCCRGTAWRKRPLYIISLQPYCSSSLASSVSLHLPACGSHLSCSSKISMLMCGLLCSLVCDALLCAVCMLFAPVLCWPGLQMAAARGISSMLHCACSLSSCSAICWCYGPPATPPNGAQQAP